MAWSLRHVDELSEDCGDAVAFPVCSDPATGTNTLAATTYHDVQVFWDNAFGASDLKLTLGANNVFAKEPPVCVSCSLNGYDAGTYALPFRFWYVDVQYKF